VRAAPEDFIAQELIPLSEHATVIDGEVAMRHVDLRPFVFLGLGDEGAVYPGGLTRVALDEGALVVNSSQNGGAKDTWVV
jgi:carboxylate-amine ligase